MLNTKAVMFKKSVFKSWCCAYQDHKRSAFTLIELSIFIVVLSIVLAAYLQGRNAMHGCDKKIDTIKKMESIVRMMEGYADKNKHLPCPAVLDLKISDANFGKSKSCSGSVPSGIKELTSSPRIWRGGVPIYNIGLPKDYAIDEWGNKILYVVLRDAADTSSDYSSLSSTDRIGMHDADGNSISSVNGVYALVSTGKDGNGSYPKDSITENTPATSRSDYQNVKTSSTDDDIYVNSYKQDDFDNLVLWRIKTEIDTAANIVNIVNSNCASCPLLGETSNSATSGDCDGSLASEFQTFLGTADGMAYSCGYAGFVAWTNHSSNLIQIRGCGMETTSPSSQFSSGSKLHACKPCTSSTDCTGPILHPDSTSYNAHSWTSKCCNGTTCTGVTSGYCSSGSSSALRCARVCSSP